MRKLLACIIVAVDRVMAPFDMPPVSHRDVSHSQWAHESSVWNQR